MKVEHKLEKGKLKHLILEEESFHKGGMVKKEGLALIHDGNVIPTKLYNELNKAMDSVTTGEGTELIPEGWLKKKKKKKLIRRVKLSEMRELKKAKFLLRLITWKDKFLVRGISVEHFDLLIDKGEKCLDEFAGMSNPLEKSEGVGCVRRDYCEETPKGKPNKEWMSFEGEIPPNHPEWGNPSKKIAYAKKTDSGSVDIVSDTNTFISFVFHGSKLKGYRVAKRESSSSGTWVFSKSSLPGEPKEETQAKHSRNQCMECSKPPKYECLWAEGIGHCWQCNKHFIEWATKGDGKGEIISVKEVQNGEAAKKFGENTNPNIWDKLKIGLNKEISD